MTFAISVFAALTVRSELMNPPVGTHVSLSSTLPSRLVSASGRQSTIPRAPSTPPLVGMPISLPSSSTPVPPLFPPEIEALVLIQARPLKFGSEAKPLTGPDV